MTLAQPPMMVRGGTHSARAMRLMIRDLARGRQGIAEAGDLKVRPLETPGAGVRIGDGSALIYGARPWQGAYTQTNIGDTQVSIPPTGPTARTDLLVLRIEDPEYEGSRDPRTGVGYFHLVPGVDLEASTVPEGMTALALARITLPRNTAAITDGMITDLRHLASPRTERTLHVTHPTTTEKAPAEHDQWTAWPKEAAWDLDIPVWATKATTVVTLSGLRAEAGNIYAELRTRLGEHNAPPTVVDDDGTTTRRAGAVILADTFTVPSTYRGSRQHLAVQINQIDKYGDGDLTVAKGTTVTAEIVFTESPV